MKALRAVELKVARANANGFDMDRTFMLVKMLEDGSHKNIHTPDWPQLSFWQPYLDHASDGITVESVTIKHRPKDGDERTLTVPARPDTASLEPVTINMHESSAQGFDMGAACNDFFTSGLGVSVKLVYLGSSLREVLMSTIASAKPSTSWTSWASSLISGPAKERITFTDCAAFMIASRTSLHDVSRRLPDGVEMDMIKFRPNIVIKGADECWEEDYWAELRLGDVHLNCVHNCVRCKSITVRLPQSRYAVLPYSHHHRSTLRQASAGPAPLVMCTRGYNPIGGSTKVQNIPRYASR